jgi:hypothetical protein
LQSTTQAGRFALGRGIPALVVRSLQSGAVRRQNLEEQMKIRVVVVCAVVLTLNTVSRASVIYDPVADFSTTENAESSVWSYRYRVGATFDGNYPLIPDYGPAAGTWTPANPGAGRPGPTGPEIGVNATADPITNTATNVA